MTNYLMCSLTDDQYKYMVLGLTYESILNYLDQLEDDYLLRNTNGLILIDQLLVTGNGRNRFIACEFKNGKLILSTAKSVIPEKKYREISVNLLRNNYELLKFSILTDYQRELVLEGQAF